MAKGPNPILLIAGLGALYFLSKSSGGDKKKEPEVGPVPPEAEGVTAPGPFDDGVPEGTTIPNEIPESVNGGGMVGGGTKKPPSSGRTPGRYAPPATPLLEGRSWISPDCQTAVEYDDWYDGRQLPVMLAALKEIEQAQAASGIVSFRIPDMYTLVGYTSGILGIDGSGAMVPLSPSPQGIPQCLTEFPYFRLERYNHLATDADVLSAEVDLGTWMMDYPGAYGLLRSLFRKMEADERLPAQMRREDLILTLWDDPSPLEIQTPAAGGESAYTTYGPASSTTVDPIPTVDLPGKVNLMPSDVPTTPSGVVTADFGSVPEGFVYGTILMGVYAMDGRPLIGVDVEMDIPGSIPTGGKTDSSGLVAGGFEFKLGSGEFTTVGVTMKWGGKVFWKQKTAIPNSILLNEAYAANIRVVSFIPDDVLEPPAVA